MNDPIMLLDDAGGVKAAPAGIANLLHQNGASVSGISPAAPELVDGIGMTCEQVRRIARDGAPVAVHPDGLERARRAREVIGRVVGARPVYGRTTGVGANRGGAAVDDAGHGLRLLRSHAGGGRAAARASWPGPCWWSGSTSCGGRLRGRPGAARRAGRGAQPRADPAGARRSGRSAPAT